MEKIIAERGRLDTTEKELLKFIPPSGERLRVLVVESPACLVELRRLLPNAELVVVTSDEFLPQEEELQGLGLQWVQADYVTERLPFAEESFDYLIAARALETVQNPADIASGFSGFLKQTGFLFTSFLNVRCWKVLDGLRDGHFRYTGRHMFALPEIEMLFYATRFKDVKTTGMPLTCPPELLDRLLACGFDNRRNDLETEVWLVRAARSMPEIAVLKSFFTAEVRRQLSWLLRRLEYGLDVAENLAALRQLCAREHIFPSYLASFMQLATWYREPLVRLLVQDYDRHGEPELADELLGVLYENDLDQDDDALAARIDAERGGRHGE